MGRVRQPHVLHLQSLPSLSHLSISWQRLVLTHGITFSVRIGYKDSHRYFWKCEDKLEFTLEEEERQLVQTVNLIDTDLIEGANFVISSQ